MTVLGIALMIIAVVYGVVNLVMLGFMVKFMKPMVSLCDKGYKLMEKSLDEMEKDMDL